MVLTLIEERARILPRHFMLSTLCCVGLGVLQWWHMPPETLNLRY